MLIEVNCETDFVARGDVFKQLASDMAMQVAACEQVTVVDTADVPTEVVEKERSIQMGKEDILTKPEAIRSAFIGCCSLCALLVASAAVTEFDSRIDASTPLSHPFIHSPIHRLVYSFTVVKRHSKSQQTVVSRA